MINKTNSRPSQDMSRDEPGRPPGDIFIFQSFKLVIHPIIWQPFCLLYECGHPDWRLSLLRGAW